MMPNVISYSRGNANLAGNTCTYIYRGTRRDERAGMTKRRENGTWRLCTCIGTYIFFFKTHTHTRAILGEIPYTHARTSTLKITHVRHTCADRCAGAVLENRWKKNRGIRYVFVRTHVHIYTRLHVHVCTFTRTRVRGTDTENRRRRNLRRRGVGLLAARPYRIHLAHCTCRATMSRSAESAPVILLFRCIHRYLYRTSLHYHRCRSIILQHSIIQVSVYLYYTCKGYFFFFFLDDGG